MAFRKYYIGKVQDIWSVSFPYEIEKIMNIKTISFLEVWSKENMGSSQHMIRVAVDNDNYKKVVNMKEPGRMVTK